MVIGPTPPGTGVMKLLRGATFSKSTSPESLNPLFFVASRMRVVPTSMMTTPDLTISAVMGGTMLAHKFHLSAPLAMVTAGLIVGNDTVRNSAMSETTEIYVDKFWELIDILLNTVLFVLIGMELLILTFNNKFIPIKYLNKNHQTPFNTIQNFTFCSFKKR